MHFVDEAMLPFSGYFRLRGIGFVWTYVVLLQCSKDRFDPSLNFGWIVARAVACQQKFQHEGRDIGPLFDAVQQILADHFAFECVKELGIKCVHRLHHVVRL